MTDFDFMSRHFDFDLPLSYFNENNGLRKSKSKSSATPLRLQKTVKSK